MKDNGLMVVCLLANTLCSRVVSVDCFSSWLVPLNYELAVADP